MKSLSIECSPTKKHPDTQIQTNPKRRRHARLISHALPSMQARSEKMRCWDTEDVYCRLVVAQLKKQNKNVSQIAQRTGQPTDQRRACQFMRQHERQHTSGRHSDCAAVSLLVTWIESVFEISPKSESNTIHPQNDACWLHVFSDLSGNLTKASQPM